MKHAAQLGSYREPPPSFCDDRVLEQPVVKQLKGDQSVFPLRKEDVTTIKLSILSGATFFVTLPMA